MITLAENAFLNKFKCFEHVTRVTGSLVLLTNDHAFIPILNSTCYFEAAFAGAFLHGGGGPQVGEVTRLAVVEK